MEFSVRKLVISRGRLVWMSMEQERGISVTSSVMQFPYHESTVNLLDTPGHEDFSEDTYRTLTAVDSALMVLDGGKGVEPRTIALMDVCRLRDTPIVSFINKLDRDIRDPIELLDEIEAVLKIKAAPITWPIGCYRDFKGVYHLKDDYIIVYTPGHGHERTEVKIIQDRDTTLPNSVKLRFDIDPKSKVKINEIAFYGNDEISDRALKGKMKKTKEQK